MLQFLLFFFLAQAPAGSIQGVVIKSATGEPLAKAVVELRAENDAAVITNDAITTDDGKFTFHSVRPGQYKIVAARAGYVEHEYASAISVGSDQHIADVRLALTQTGTIYGHVVDRTGRPLTNATVRALKATYPEGRRTLKSEQTSITNDLGEFRLFWLTPGSYFLSALPYSSQEHTMAPMLTAGVEPKNDPGVGIGSRGVLGLEGVSVSVSSSSILNKSMGALGPNEAYVQNYFPGTTDPDRASVIEVTPGANYGSVDMTVTPVPTHRVSGVIMNGITRQPHPRAQLRRARASAVDVCASPGMNPENCRFEIVDYDRGTFDIPAVTPGSYVLYAMDNESNLLAQASLEVRDSDVDNLVITLQPALTITGRIRPAASNIDVQLKPGPPVPARNLLAGSSLLDGAFSIRGVTTGDFAVSVSGLKGSYVQSIKLGDFDVLSGGLHVTGKSNEDLEITLGFDPGTIEGRISKAGGEPAANVTVVLRPDAAGLNRTDLFKATRTSATGSYQFQDVAPGDYNIYAWEDVESGAWFDGTFMRTYEGLGKSVRVTASSKQTIDTAAIPPRIF